MDNINKRIEYTLDFLDYSKIHKAMDALDWNWVGSTFGIPEAWELRQAARNLLTAAVSTGKRTGGHTIYETGGFRAEYLPEADAMSIAFLLEQSDDQFYSEDYFELYEGETIDLNLLEKTTADIIQLDDRS